MRNMINRFLSLSAWLAVGVMALTSCSSSDVDTWYDDENDEANVVTISITDDGNTDNLSAGSNIGLFVIDGNGNPAVSNQMLTLGTGGSATLPDVALTGQLIVYSPYQTDWEHALSEKSRFDVQDNQSTAEGYKASDLLIGSGDASQLSMKHVLSRIVVHITDETGDVDMGEMNVQLLNKTGSVMVDLRNASTESVADSEKDIAMYPYELSDWRLSLEAIVAPQTITNGDEFLEFSRNGRSQVFYIPQDATLEGGKTFIYYFRLTQTGVIFDGTTITNWRNGGTTDDIKIITDDNA